MNMLILAEDHTFALVETTQKNRLASLTDVGLNSSDLVPWSIQSYDNGTAVLLGRKEHMPCASAVTWAPLSTLTQWPDSEVLSEAYSHCVLGGFKPHSYDFAACYFGSDAQQAASLAHLICKGTKHATTGRKKAYAYENIALPQPGQRILVTDYFGIPLFFIRTTAVKETTFSSITEEEAAYEGEGDLSLSHWRTVHRDFFEHECAAQGTVFTEDETLIYETFELDHVLSPTPKTPETKLIDQQLIAYNKRDTAAFLRCYANPVRLYFANQQQPVLESHQQLFVRYDELFRTSPNLFCEIRTRFARGKLVTDTEYIYGRRGETEVLKMMVTYEVEGDLIQSVTFT